MWETALRQHRWQRTLDPPGIPLVSETVGETRQKVDLAIHFTQQQSPAIARHLPAGKSSFDMAGKMGCKKKRFLDTLCHEKGLRLRANTAS
jgi:hypothetical protein